MVCEFGQSEAQTHPYNVINAGPSFGSNAVE